MHFLLLTVLNVGVAMVIFFALCPWVRRHLAFAVACVWVVLPNHTSLSYWPSTLPALLALIGLFGGIAALGRGRWRLAAGAFIAGVLCYELVLVPAAAAVVVFALLRRPRLRWTAIATLGGGLMAVAGWMLAHPTHPPERQSGLLADGDLSGFGVLWSGHFGPAATWSSATGWSWRPPPSPA